MYGTLDPEDRERALRYMRDDPATFRDLATRLGWISEHEAVGDRWKFLLLGLALGGWFGFLLAQP